MIKPESAKQTLRVLRYLGDEKPATKVPFDDGRKTRIMLSLEDSKPIVVPPEALDNLHKASLISVSEDTVRLTPEGAKRLRRAAAVAGGADDGGFREQHRHTVTAQIDVDGARQDVMKNAEESPLARLSTRKMKSGEPWIDAAALEAGERLRRDFTRGQLMQSVTANWDASMGANKGKGGAGGKADISDSAIDARSRLHNALDAVGPELGGVLTDICCFLKGFENVERERRWPPRSAKVMVRVGLNLLARHYGTIAGHGSRSEGKIVATP